MPNIFISYRREDSLGHTGRLFDRLGKHFGKAHVFMDIAGIEPGLDFVEAIDKAVGSCDVFIVVIGKQWLNVTDSDGRRRLENQEDFIRLELGTALKRNIRVIPVLVQGASAPSSENLPEDLRMLSRRQAIEVSDNRLDFDAGELIKTIEKSLKANYPVRFWWSKIPRWAIVVFVLTLFSVGVNIFLPTERWIEPSIEMPNVVGEPFEKVKGVLTEKGLTVKVEERQATDGAGKENPPGMVIDQNPRAGTEVKKGQQVYLVLAVRPAIEMPDVRGLQMDQAKALLQKAGLTVPEVAEIRTKEKPAGTVLVQDPDPGTRVGSGQRLRLEVEAKVSINMPNVVGMQLKKAEAVLTEKGLAVSTKVRQTREKDPGTVIDQSPKAGNELANGRSVELLIASEPLTNDGQKKPYPGPALEAGNSMPDLFGLTYKSAKAILERRGLVVITRSAPPGTERPGTVIDQDPKPGGEMGSVRVVQLIIASPPSGTATAPNLVGKNVVEAEAILAERGLFVSQGSAPPSKGPPGTVIDQDPKPGGVVGSGLMVRLVVVSPLPGTTAAPNLVGETYVKAKDMIQGKGLFPSVKLIPSDKSPPGTVIDQNPEAGQEMGSGLTVQLVVASPPPGTK